MIAMENIPQNLLPKIQEVVSVYNCRKQSHQQWATEFEILKAQYHLLQHHKIRYYLITYAQDLFFRNLQKKNQKLSHEIEEYTMIIYGKIKYC